MCGFVGIVSNNIENDKEWLIKANNLLIHRGPDDFGVFFSKNNQVGLAHRRLSIVDTSNHGHQPMSLNSNVIVFNGEIYNFKELREDFIKEGIVFKSSSDTEIILYAYKKWGQECTKYLNGMFAFVIYDEDKNILFMARDRAGEKPFFYKYNKDTREFLFASELKAIVSKPNVEKIISYEGLSCYLDMGFVPCNNSILENINKLPAAHTAIFDIETFNFEINRYWSIPKYKSDLIINETKLIDKLENLLQDSVEKQLIADVPIGVLLSGGVDSSLITAMATRCRPSIKTFFVGFDDFKHYDESSHAKLIAEHFKTEHITLNASSVNPDILIELARQYDEPIIDSSIVPTYLVSKLVSKYCKVVLGGDGGDELFGGYTHYSRMLWLENKFKNTPFFLRNIISLLSKEFLTTGFKGKNWLSALDTNFNFSIPKIATYFDNNEKNRLFKGLEKYNYAIERYELYSNCNEDLLQRATKMDFENYLVEDILVKVDRASMLNSLEIRAPFLDYRLIEFAFSEIPSSLKATKNQKKILLKKFAQKVLPNTFDFKRKQGFSIPLEYWLKKGEWRDFFHDILLSRETIFEKKYIFELFKGLDNGRNNSERLFALVMFELWRKEYNIKIT
ncbi:asparagine synthase (glutamine-hydrolyzing) [Arcobacter cryaerophilus gv. pseudocryaerophilus]|uniref:asparagine synthase (glutamine-hydrolyzing) n=2 Tax=Arcobacteraceae TaxID=2808963 RepID=A0AAU0P3A9_9BACT|nr:asparagine synthase (glutamine-hydrolyzing) [Arcobacter sp. AZ-2023]WPD03059.1 asparagine synthase (glutamine-hydrolyzing) [Arcobacter sp. DSM 115972]